MDTVYQSHTAYFCQNPWRLVRYVKWKLMFCCELDHLFLNHVSINVSGLGFQFNL